MKIRTVDVIFWLFYIGTLCAFIFRTEQYERPIVFFVFLAMAVAILGVQITRTLHERKSIAYTFSKIAMLALTIQWSQLLVYPDSFLGTDTWYHHTIVDKIVNGIAPHKNDYYGTLVFHYMVGDFVRLTGLTEKWSTMVAIGLPYSAVMLWVVYRFGKMLYSYKAGLMSALVLCVASMFIFFGIELIPASLSMMFVIVAVYLIYEAIRQKNVKVKVGCYAGTVVVLCLIALTNALMAIFVVLLSGLMWLGFFIYDKAIAKVHIFYWSFLIICIVYTLGTLAWWTFGTNQIGIVLRLIGNEDLVEAIAPYVPVGKTLLRLNLVRGINYFGDVMPDADYWIGAFTHLTSIRYGEVMGIVNNYQSNIPFLETVAKRGAIVLYGLFSLYGVWRIRGIVKYKPFAFMFLLCAVIIVVTNFANVFLSRYFFVSRHIFLSQIFLAPLAGVGLLGMADLVKNHWKYAVLGICLFVLSFVAFVSPYATIDNRDFQPYSGYRLALTQEEIESIDTICATWQGSIYSDWYVSYYMYHAKRLHKEWKSMLYYDASEYLALSDYSKIPKNSIVIIRDEIEYPTLIADKFYQIPKGQESNLVSQGFKKVYDDSIMRGYVKDEVKTIQGK